MSRRRVLAPIVVLALVLPGAALADTAVGAAADTAGPSTITHPALPASPRLSLGRTGLESSLNWAGYAVTGTTMSSVSGSWVVPSASCPKNATQEDSTWVGIDGFASTDPSVQQIGTDSDCAKTKRSHVGTPLYFAWYEMYPASAVLLPQSLYPVAPGEVISGSVTLSGSTYTLSLTNGVWHFSTNQTPSSRLLNASAEWITEAPTHCTGSSCAVFQLADFGVLAFTNALADGQAITSRTFTSTQIDMANKSGKKLKARTSALGPGGSSFTVTWLHK